LCHQVPTKVSTGVDQNPTALLTTLGGSSAPSSLSSTTLHALDAMALRSLQDTLLQRLTNKPEALLELNFTNARLMAVGRMKDFRGIPTSGHSSRLDVGELASLQTVSVCYVVQPAQKSDGYGTAKIITGRRSIPSTKDAGYTLMRVRRRGTTQESIQKGGAARRLTALPSPQMVQPM
jgi:hypothetical protein